MSYTVEFVENDILVGTWNADFDFGEEFATYDKEVVQALDNSSQAVYFIHQFNNFKMSMQDIMAGASRATKGDKPAFLHDNIKQVIFITTSAVYKMTAKGFKTASFGNVDVKVFDTLDEAISFIRSEAA